MLWYVREGGRKCASQYVKLVAGTLFTTSIYVFGIKSDDLDSCVLSNNSLRHFVRFLATAVQIIVRVDGGGLVCTRSTDR